MFQINDHKWHTVRNWVTFAPGFLFPQYVCGVLKLSKYYCLWIGCEPWTVFSPFYANIIFLVIKLKQECRLRNNDFFTHYFETNLF